MKICAAFIALFTLTFFSCNYLPCSTTSDLSGVKNIPAYTELAGIYKPDIFTKQDVPGFHNADSTYLELTKNGKVYLREFPKNTFAFIDNPKDSGIKVNSNGSWICGYQNNKVSITMQLQLANSPVLSLSEFLLYKKDDKFMLLLNMGDPDNCLALRLIRQP